MIGIKLTRTRISVYFTTILCKALVTLSERLVIPQSQNFLSCSLVAFTFCCMLATSWPFFWILIHMRWGNNELFFKFLPIYDAQAGIINEPHGHLPLFAHDKTYFCRISCLGYIVKDLNEWTPLAYNNIMYAFMMITFKFNLCLLSNICPYLLNRWLRKYK